MIHLVRTRVVPALDLLFGSLQHCLIKEKLSSKWWCKCILLKWLKVVHQVILHNNLWHLLLKVMTLSWWEPHNNKCRHQCKDSSKWWCPNNFSSNKCHKWCLLHLCNNSTTSLHRWWEIILKVFRKTLHQAVRINRDKIIKILCKLKWKRHSVRRRREKDWKGLKMRKKNRGLKRNVKSLKGGIRKKMRVRRRNLMI